ncbi:hypothetical protein L1987_15522 [Smallanthus sonchifolius]|uniref:Uncharacterized protein n=1 Tax=Smallanthus sonchifolius TaxID=185202 RepID=A0ACB9J6M4_9ASTR|nr:hypothetical protein L1987_15522 [Smallanthus sonchifolius]
MLTAPTGLHHGDQKLIYKDKERASKTFLDFVGVKDKSKMVVLEDPISREKRLIEARTNAKSAKAAKLILEISMEVDRLAGQVAALESVVSRGGKVADKMVLDLIESLMNQLLKLDEIKVDGDVNQQKKLQVEKVQRYVETLDVLKIKNAAGHDGATAPNHHQSRRSVGKPKFSPMAVATRQQEASVGKPKFSPMAVATRQQEASSKKTSEGVVVTTQWETFDSLPTVFSAPPSTSTTGETIQHDFNWDLLLK